MTNGNFGLEPQGPDMKRLLLAVLLTSGLLMVYNHFFAPSNQPVSQPIAAEVLSVPKTVIAAPVQAPDIHATATDIPVKEQEFSADVKSAMAGEPSMAIRGGYAAHTTNVGAQVKSFLLTGYADVTELSGVDNENAYLFALESRDFGITLGRNARYELVSSAADEVTYEYVTAEGVKVLRRYQFLPDQFVVKQTIEFSNLGQSPRNLAIDLRMVGGDKKSGKKSSFFSGSEDGASAVCHVGKRVTHTQEDLKKGQKEETGAVVYAGFDKRYFLAAVTPKDSSKATGCTAKYWAKTQGSIEQTGVEVTIHQASVMLAPGEKHVMGFDAYLGPKQLSLLRAQGHGLEDNIDFGFMAVISRPLQWLLLQIFSFVGNFGIAIALLTLLIKMVTFPLTQKSFVSMQQAKKLAPELKALQQKYSHDRTLLGQKQMEFYKERGVNPLAGCLPMLIQMPVWIALYQMLWNSVELYEQPFYLWIHDLTKADPYYVMPLLMGVSMAVQQAFQPPPDDQPQMKYVMWGMPVFLTFVMLNMPAGLNLYILTNNVLTILQQLLIKRRYST